MATFKPGQRIRAKPVPGLSNDILAGREGIFLKYKFIGKGATVVGVGSGGRVGISNHDCDCVVRYKDYPVDVADHTDFIEPIQYDGNQAITWDACCWRPPHMREPANPCKEWQA